MPGTTDLTTTTTAAAKALLQTLEGLGKAESVDLTAFANKYGMAAARWGIQLAQAKQSANQPLIDAVTENFAFMADAAVMRAANAGIIAQSDGENTLIAILRAVAHFAGAVVV